MGKLQFQANRHDCDTPGTEIRTLGATHNAAASFTGLATRKTKYATANTKFYALDCISNSRGGFSSGGSLVSRFAGFVRWEVRKTRCR
jgi:hypothetical protein